MGRRSLPRVDPNIDLRDYLITLAELPETWQLPSLFSETRPLEVEVGSGKGLFLCRAAADRPDHAFVGIEIAHKYARFAAARMARRSLVNAKILDGDAMQLFTHHIPDESLAAVHVYFPDPWWKKRHRKRRIMNDLFLRQVERTLRTGGGELHFWTDVEEYFHEALAQIVASTNLQGPWGVDEAPAEHDLDYRTHFERRMRLHELPVYRSRFVRT